MIYLHRQGEIGEWPEEKSISREFVLNQESFQKGFLNVFEEITAKKFDPDANKGETGMLAQLFRSYLLSEHEFLQNPLLADKPENRSLKKGLLIIGRPGTGKTSIAGSFYRLINETPVQFDCTREAIGDKWGQEKLIWNTPTQPVSILAKMSGAGCQLRGNLRINFIKADKLVKEYEKYLKGDPNDFLKINGANNGGSMWVIDDILAERTANNYGDRLETMTRILEDMEYREQPLIFTCNLHENLKETLAMIAKRYGPRAYDRLFSSLNIVELKGGSLRK